MSDPTWLQTLLTLGLLAAAIVTAGATGVLGWYTRGLVRQTHRMVEASSRPHVVATIDPNRWSMLHADITLQNTGNATAYDIDVAFDPPLHGRGPRETDAPPPLTHISVLKPGQDISSYLSEFAPLLGQTFAVTVTWRRHPADREREANSYSLNIGDLEGVSRLGADDPLTQIAEQIKKMREDWQHVARGSSKTRVDIFTSMDRLHERRQHNRWLRQQRQQQAKTTDTSE